MSNKVDTLVDEQRQELVDRQYYRDLVRAATSSFELHAWNRKASMEGYSTYVTDIANTACDTADAVLAEVKRREKADE